MPDAAWRVACHRDELKNHQFVEFMVTPGTDDEPEQTGFVFLADDEPRAYLNRCPHLGIELNWMPGRFMDSEQCFIQCSTHGALFRTDDGHCIAGPCQGDALTPLDTRQEDGQILVNLSG